LWVAVGGDGQAGALHTKGMSRFGAPEICLSKQPNADSLMVDYCSMWRSPFSPCSPRFPTAIPWTAPKAS
jgi:hypothetical protein